MQPLGDFQVRFVLLVPHQLLNHLREAKVNIEEEKMDSMKKDNFIVQSPPTSISPSVRSNFVGKSEFLRMRPPSQDFSTLLARSVMDFAPPKPSRLIPFSEPSGDLG